MRKITREVIGRLAEYKLLPDSDKTYNEAIVNLYRDKFLDYVEVDLVDARDLLNTIIEWEYEDQEVLDLLESEIQQLHDLMWLIENDYNEIMELDYEKN